MSFLDSNESAMILKGWKEVHILPIPSFRFSPDRSKGGDNLPSVATTGVTLEGANPGPLSHGFETCPEGTRRMRQAVEADKTQR